jgi:hypothetical protein
MVPTELLDAYEARLALYSIDDRVRRILVETWPLIAPNLDGAVDEILVVSRVLPSVGDIVAQNSAMLKKLELAHFQALLGGKLDRHYAEICRNTVAQEAALGLDARRRSISPSRDAAKKPSPVPPTKGWGNQNGIEYSMEA